MRRRQINIENGPTHRSGKPVIFRISWGVRKYIIKRDGFICQYCKTYLTFENHTIDHIFPVSHGGTEDPNNLVMCCKGCNRRAGNLLFSTFETKKQYLQLKAQEAKISMEANYRNSKYEDTI